MDDDKILKYVCQNCGIQQLNNIIKTQECSGITAQEIEQVLHIARPHVSAILNDLVKKGDLVKINSRPVYFLPFKLLHDKYKNQEISSSYMPQEFIQLLKSMSDNINPFNVLVGANGSLANQVELGKAAILYPPKGLHTLIIGESGTGKTVFARAMYEFGVESFKHGYKQFPYVEFNCADYYHNPQLLISQLFGYIKGAFTGADKDTSGLVEKANGGILFLDEVHRLPPEGQEMLFYLMDTGRYRKLGESDNLHHANVLIIAATTEAPESVLTSTFIRRIPLVIKLPAYQDRPVEERLQIIQHIVQCEAIATQKTYVVSPSILRALIVYDFPGNIGQVTSEIKVLCARAFLENKSHSEELVLSMDNLSLPVLQNNKCVIKPDGLGILHRVEPEWMIVKPDEITQYTSLLNEHAYQKLIKQINELINKGFNKQEVEKQLSKQINDYCNDILNSYNSKEIRKEELYKVVDPKIIDFTTEILKEFTTELGLQLTQKNILVLALHFKYLLERTNTSKGISPTKMSYMEQDARPELSIANKIVMALEKRFNTKVPPEEKYFIGILLINITHESSIEHPCLFIIAHGVSTATSIASVCNQLMNCNFVRAVDAPLNQSIEETYQLLSSEIQNTVSSKGAIILADMGSLITFGDRLSKESGIHVRTLANVSTLMALDITRKLLSEDSDIDYICQEYLSKNNAVKCEHGVILPHAILVICASGVGTSKAFCNMVSDMLKEKMLEHINTIAMSLNDVKNKTVQYQKLCNNYKIIACIGNTKCMNDIPFFHVTELISSKGKQKFLRFVTQSDNVFSNRSEDSPLEKLEAECCSFLAQNVVCLNPEISVQYSEQFLNSLELTKITENDALRSSLLLHLGFMIERNICNKKVLFDNQEAFINAHKEIFDLLRSKIYMLESVFEVKVNDAELCFIIQTIDGYS